MKPFLLLPTMITSTFFVGISLLSGQANEIEGSAKPIMAPAATAKEWIENSKGQRLNLPELYATLPPQTQWPAVLNWLTKEQKQPNELALRIFGNLLKNDTKQVSEGIRLLLLKKPEIEPYSYDKAVYYISLFAENSDEAKQWAEKNLKIEQSPSFPSSSHGSSTPEELDTFLGENKIDEALAIIRKEINETEGIPLKLQLLGKQAEIAQLMERRPLYESTISEMKQIVATIKPESVSYSNLNEYILELKSQKDWQGIRDATRLIEKSDLKEIFLLKLLTAWHLDGPAAFLTEFKNAPAYKIKDRIAYFELLTSNNYPEYNLGEMVVRAYQATGEPEKAHITLSYLLALDMENDAFYKLSIELFPTHAAEMFQSVRPFDLYEERPLIWLADLALRTGDLAQAQTLIDEAIALDPADGDQTNDTRMQAYDVLSRVLRAKGDATKADFLTEVVKSIRLGEVADNFRRSGLTEEAIHRYRDALGHFEDAYCLHSRLAKTLLESGRIEEALVHYRKAFELMPVSFGPVESHCFGCEGIFHDTRVQPLAKETFEKIIANTPQNPRTYYLMGQLNEQMKQPQLAIAAYRKAWELDPRYYNCAAKLVELLEKSFSTAREAQILLPRLIAITPYVDLPEVYSARTDLKQAWEDSQTPPPSPLHLKPIPLPFAAAKKVKRSNDNYLSPRVKAIDGWSPEELLKDNALVTWLQYF